MILLAIKGKYVCRRVCTLIPSRWDEAPITEKETK